MDCPPIPSPLSGRAAICSASATNGRKGTRPASPAMHKLTRRQFGLSAVAAAGLQGQNLLTERWPARWIAVPDTAPRAYGVYLFRKTAEMASVPASFKVNVTADSRYRFFVNGQSVAFGPARGDLLHWRY